MKQVSYPIHPLLRERWSPYAIDPAKPVSDEDLYSLLEAARWCMSSYNAQPWRYVIGVRDMGPHWQQVLDVLVPANRTWAQHAPVLILTVASHHFATNDKRNKAALYDLGAASALLTVEACARNLSVHQMIGIDPDKARATFSIKEKFEPMTVLAIGYRGAANLLGEPYAQRDAQAGVKERKPLGDIVIASDL